MVYVFEQVVDPFLVATGSKIESVPILGMISEIF